VRSFPRGAFPTAVR